MKKKTLALLSSTALLSLALAGTIGAVAASAEEITGPQSSTGTKVEWAAVEETWTVTTPDTLTIGGGEGQKITAKGILTEGHKLKITATSAGGWKVAGQSYKLTCDKNEVTADNGLVCEFETLQAEVESESAEVKAELVSEYDYAHEKGDDTITWHIESVTAE